MVARDLKNDPLPIRRPCGVIADAELAPRRGWRRDRDLISRIESQTSAVAAPNRIQRRFVAQLWTQRRVCYVQPKTARLGDQEWRPDCRSSNIGCCTITPRAFDRTGLSVRNPAHSRRAALPHGRLRFTGDFATALDFARRDLDYPDHILAWTCLFARRAKDNAARIG